MSQDSYDSTARPRAAERCREGRADRHVAGAGRGVAGAGGGAGSNVALRAENVALRAENAALQAKNAALREKLKLPPKTPDNSSLPPSQGRKASSEASSRPKSKAHPG